MTLIAPGVPVNRDTLDAAIERAALSCARGPVQAAVVLDLIETGYLKRKLVKVPGISVPVFQYPHNLSGRSWGNLRKRLQAAGFRFVKESQSNTAPDDVRLSIYWTV